MTDYQNCTAHTVDRLCKQASKYIQHLFTAARKQRPKIINDH